MFYEPGKRIMDIFGALIGIILFSPIMLFTAIYIKLVSPKGPIFADIPDRVGKDNTSFRMYKFRSMIPNAHEWMKSQPELYKKYLKNNFKLENDPRWLPGASLMRKLSIDEMPQFFNVLKGEMSIVGPRAYYPFELQKHIENTPEVATFVNQAMTIKPGVTGPWQIGGRSEVHFIDRIKIDANYAKNRSLIYDLMIILKTPFAVLTGKGAV